MSISQVSMQVSSNFFSPSPIGNQQNKSQKSFGAILQNILGGQNSIGINPHSMTNDKIQEYANCNNGISSMGLMDRLFGFSDINDNLKMNLFMQALDSLSGFLNGDFLCGESDEDESLSSLFGYPSEESLFGLYGSAVTANSYSSLLDLSTRK